MIEVAKSAGFCFGVDRAVNIVYSLISENKKCATLGPIIHNPQLVDDLIKKGVLIEDNIDAIPKDYTVVIRSHGVCPEVVEKLKQSGHEFVDATCPFVAKIQKIVMEKYREGARVFIAGDKSHPEVQGINGYCQNTAFVFGSEEELIKEAEKHPENCDKKTILVAQTTFNKKILKKCLEIAKKLYTKLEFFDTICNATSQRQEEALKLSRKSDIVFVIGGRTSSNTNKLYDVCRENCKTVLIETADEIEKSDLLGVSAVGVTAGASTPAYIIEEVKNKMSEILENEEFSFEEALEQSFKKIYRGAKVKGTVAFITGNEIGVDISSKYAGFVPYDEYSDDPSEKIEDLKRGDELDLVVVSVNDQEGRVLLSKKRFDQIDSFSKIQKAFDEGEVLNGTVSDVVNGGVIVFANGMRIFIPASQTGIKKDGDLNTLLKTKVDFKLIDVNPAKRRAVGSIRAVVAEKRREAEEKFWSQIKEGDVVKATVKSLTSFGAFADLGGVDGLVHITELSWSKIKHPSEVVNVGDEIEVYIKELDAEKKRISLGYKKAEDNPWEKMKEYNEGDVVNVKIVSITAFGAFANLIPGVDGLIHISQISNEKVNKVADVLKVGDEVTAKIIGIDFENAKLSLSIRALLEEKAAEDEKAIVEESGVEVTEE